MKKLNYEQLALEFETTSISLTKLAEREGTTRQTLARHFKELGIEIINKQNRSKFDEHIFDVIDTEEKAYWLGFIFADGYIGSTPLKKEKKSVYNFELSLQIGDRSHLEKFRNFIQYEKPITVNSYRCRLMISNKHLWETLNSYGCTPRKSLTLQFPNESIFKERSLIRHFIRGYFDGDGCYSRHIHSKTVSPHLLIIGTSDFLSKIVKYSSIEGTVRHDKRHSNETMFLDYNKENSIKLAKFLYDKASVYLDRKYKLYNFFKEGSRSLQEYEELLETNIGEGCDVNPEISTETKESVPSYSVDGETYIWKPMQLLESGCYSCEIPKDKHGNCKCPKYPCSNYNGYYVRI